MKTTNKITLYTLAFFLSVFSAMAQDPRHSQPLGNHLLLNPAMMALTNDVRLQFSYRNQWASIDKGYTTYNVSLQAPVFLGSKKDSTSKMAGKSRLDFGVNITNDKRGGFNNISTTLSIGYGLKLNPENMLAVALNFGYIHQTFNVNQTFDEQYQWGTFNENLPTGETLNKTKGAPDVGLGFVWHYAHESGKIQAFAGLGAYHVNQPNLTLVGGRGTLPARFNAQAGVKIIGNKMDFTPVVLYNIQGRFKQFSGGLLAAYKFGEKQGKLVVGTWYKQSDAITIQAGYEHKYFMFNYSYDFGISRLARSTKGLMTHEVTVGFKVFDMAGKKGIKSVGFL